MDDASTHLPSAEADREKRWVAFSSLLAAILLDRHQARRWAVDQQLGHPLGSGAFGPRSGRRRRYALGGPPSGRPADREHPYGHGKIENLSALFETVLLLVVCFWIVGEATDRLFLAEKPVDANIWAFLVVILSIAVDYSRSRSLMKAARKHDSQALEADALHFSTDIWSSAVVLVGLCGVLAGQELGVPWLVKIDAVAALGVAMIVIGVSFRLGKKSVNDLLDSVPGALRDQVTTAARRSARRRTSHSDATST